MAAYANETRSAPPSITWNGRRRASRKAIVVVMPSVFAIRGEKMAQKRKVNSNIRSWKGSKEVQAKEK